MLIGYARVSTGDQNLDLQTDALSRAGCEKILTDKTSGAKDDRPGLARVLELLRGGDTLIVWRLDRLGRSLSHLISTTAGLEARGVGFRSLQEGIDTTTPDGKLVFHVFGALAEFERSLITERTQAGLVAARARGRNGGRPQVLTKHQLLMARRMLDAPDVSVSQVAEHFGISRSTLYRLLKQDSHSERTR